MALHSAGRFAEAGAARPKVGNAGRTLPFDEQINGAMLAHGTCVPLSLVSGPGRTTTRTAPRPTARAPLRPTARAAPGPATSTSTCPATRPTAGPATRPTTVVARRARIAARTGARAAARTRTGATGTRAARARTSRARAARTRAARATLALAAGRRGRAQRRDRRNDITDTGRQTEQPECLAARWSLRRIVNHLSVSLLLSDGVPLGFTAVDRPVAPIIRRPISPVIRFSAGSDASLAQCT